MSVRCGCDFKRLNGSTLGRKSFLNTMTRMRRIQQMLRHEIHGAVSNQWVCFLIAVSGS
jgi:hypothetical protein